MGKSRRYKEEEKMEKRKIRDRRQRMEKRREKEEKRMERRKIREETENGEG